jgi:hypothetical protein
MRFFNVRRSCIVTDYGVRCTLHAAQIVVIKSPDTFNGKNHGPGSYASVPHVNHVGPLSHNRKDNMKRTLTLLIVLCASTLSAQEVFNNCGMEGDAKSPAVKLLDRKKNRYDAPKPADVDATVTLKAMLRPGDDEHRWSDRRAAEITGYVYDAKPGGVESCNCHAKDKYYRDTHIELVLDPMDQAESKRVIVEVTPRWRAMMKARGLDWTTSGIRKAFLGRWVKVRGWLLFDDIYRDQSENTNPGRARNWRATCWEVHPVTSMEIVSRPK